jgi:hypothetical protein
MSCGIVISRSHIGCCNDGCKMQQLQQSKKQQIKVSPLHQKLSTFIAVVYTISPKQQ